MLGFGALAEFPLLDFGDERQTTWLSLPAVSFGFTPFAVGLQAGRNLGMPAPEVTVWTPAVGVHPGKLIGLPALDVLWDARPLIPSPGKSFGLPSLNVALSYGTLRIETGRIFNLANTIFVTTDVGALADGALGEFAIGEGEPVSQEFSRPVEFRFSLYAAGVQAGRNIDLTAPDILFDAPVPEIAARHRKLRVLAITS